MEELKNWEVEGDKALVTINPSLFPVEVVYSAAYTLMDVAYFILDGDPQQEIKVEITVKDDEIDPAQLARRFNNELLNYSVYVTQAARNQNLREAIIQRALKTNSVNYDQRKKELNKVKQDAAVDEKKKSGDENFKESFNDPKGIREPWKPEDAPDYEPNEAGDNEK